MRNQKCWNVKGFVAVSEENIGFDIPNCVSSGVASLSESSWRETGSISFSFQKVWGVKVAISLRIHATFAEEIVQVEESFLFFWDTSWSGEAEECVVKSSFLLGPFENLFGLFIEFSLCNGLIEICQRLDWRCTIVFIAHVVCSVLSEQTDFLWDFVFFHLAFFVKICLYTEFDALDLNWHNLTKERSGKLWAFSLKKSQLSMIPLTALLLVSLPKIFCFENKKFSICSRHICKVFVSIVPLIQKHDDFELFWQKNFQIGHFWWCDAESFGHIHAFNN